MALAQRDPFAVGSHRPRRKKGVTKMIAENVHGCAARKFP
jgi:hypothetical protein